MLMMGDMAVGGGGVVLPLPDDCCIIGLRIYPSNGICACFDCCEEMAADMNICWCWCTNAGYGYGYGYGYGWLFRW